MIARPQNPDCIDDSVVTAWRASLAGDRSLPWRGQVGGQWSIGAIRERRFEMRPGLRPNPGAPRDRR